ncbi:MAG TPA: F0F1 ATP synthase subunit delta [Kineosporiaceae bacterium]|nr:F0F1 ATP synthase subunit delta [Kineosporiaceae bacterium]
MRGISRESLAAGQERLEALLSARGAQPQALGDELFAVANLLAGNASLRRALTDPSREAEDKAGLVQRLLTGKVSGETLDLLAGLVRGRWGSPLDLADALEALAVSAVLAAAERADRLDSVEDELFRFSRLVAGTTQLRDAFSARTEGDERKAELVQRLLSGKAAPETVQLAVQAAVHPRGLRTERALETFVEAAAERRRQLVAHVVAAVPLTAAQRERLAASLRRTYGRPIRLNVDLDPEVRGGLRVQVGGELIDGTIATRLDEARRRLAG